MMLSAGKRKLYGKHWIRSIATHPISRGSESVPLPSGRLAAVVQYQGSQFHGWQRQAQDVRSVQQVVELAFSRVADHTVETVCAGRTDAGVHASFQVIHFDTQVARSPRSWVMGANSHLPADVSIGWVGDVSPEFNARFSARSRRYRYLIFNHPVRPALFRQEMTWNYRPLNAHLMAEAGAALVGRHDFTSFRATGCQAKSPVREVSSLAVWRRGPMVVIDIEANAFLHHMVRNIAGVLMAIGAGRRPLNWAAEVLAARHRKQGGVTAPPFGLYLTDVVYDPVYDMPRCWPGADLVNGLTPISPPAESASLPQSGSL